MNAIHQLFKQIYIIYQESDSTQKIQMSVITVKYDQEICFLGYIGWFSLYKAQFYPLAYTCL